MAKKAKTKEVIDLYGGISIGLLYWLFFMVAFYWLGYSGAKSIVLGGIAGLAGGWAIAWWRAKEEAISQGQIEALEKTDADLAGASLTRVDRDTTTPRRYRRAKRNVSLWQLWRRQ